MGQYRYSPGNPNAELWGRSVGGRLRSGDVVTLRADVAALHSDLIDLAAPPPPAPDSSLREHLADVSACRLKDTAEALGARATDRRTRPRALAWLLTRPAAEVLAALDEVL